jgi:hypothetical protein
MTDCLSDAGRPFRRDSRSRHTGMPVHLEARGLEAPTPAIVVIAEAVVVIAEAVVVIPAAIVVIPMAMITVPGRSGS